MRSTRVALAAFAVSTALAAMPARAHAQEDASHLGAPAPRSARPAERAPRADAEPPSDGAAAAWDGPRVELGYAHYALPDGFGGGTVHTGVFGGFLPTSPVRLGAWAEMGVREYELSSDDFLVRASAIAGYQHRDFRPFIPYAGVVGTVGVVFGERYRTPESWVFGGAGVEIGGEVNLVSNLWLGVGLAYLRISLGGNGYDVLAVRLRVGL